MIEAGDKLRKTSGPRHEKKSVAGWRVKWTAIGIEFGTLFLFWILLSGRSQLKYLIIGLFAAALVTYLTSDLFYGGGRSRREPHLGSRFVLSCALRLINYAPWLVLAIVKANFQVASMVLRRRMAIDPVLLQFETLLQRKVSRVTLANSITLTPGTITIEEKNGKYLVHALARGTAGDLETGLMQNKVAAVFGDREAPAPACKWGHSRKELER